MLHVWLFREASRWVTIGQPPHTLWRGLDAWPALAVIAVFLALALAVSRAWQRVEYRFGAEWLLRRLGGGKSA
jgi:hypothetical protein